MWNKNYLFFGCNDNTIKLIELNKYGLLYKIVKTLIGHDDIVKNITKIIHPIFGECLLSQGAKGRYSEEIIIWFKNCFSNLTK